MACDRIGFRLSDSDALTFGDAQSDRTLLSAYVEESGMEYIYHTESGLLAAWHEDVGLVTYYRITSGYWQDILDGVV